MNDGNKIERDSKPHPYLSSFIARLLSASKKKRQKYSEDDVNQLLEEGKKSGVINTTERELIESVLEFTDTTVKEIMVPRTDVVAVELSVPREKLIRVVIDEGYSRVPVYQGTIDNIIGIVYTKDLLSMFEHRDIILLQDIIRPPYFVPESKKISVLMRELQTKKQHMAIVIDEFGGTEGIITMEDILEEIVGEIRDEYDEDHRDVETSVDGSVVVNAGMSIHDFNEKFHSEIPDDVDYETISGFLHKQTGRIPELFEEIPFANLSFVVVKKNDRRIRQVKVKVVDISHDGRRHE
ncbi:MAG: hemolysin family protein [Bacteroidota bacterium]